MPGEEKSAEFGYVAYGDLTVFDLEQFETEKRQQKHESVQPRSPYEIMLRGEPIPLSYTEYRILQLLVRKPYHAFSRRQIVDTVSVSEDPVTEATLDRHIASLRGKLGMFSDYIQSVPYIGYRFKL